LPLAAIVLADVESNDVARLWSAAGDLRFNVSDGSVVVAVVVLNGRVGGATVQIKPVTVYVGGGVTARFVELNRDAVGVERRLLLFSTSRENIKEPARYQQKSYS
jgi:hypothetical protein